MLSEQFEHFFGFFGVDLEEENSNIFESLFQSTSNFANFRIPLKQVFCQILKVTKFWSKFGIKLAKFATNYQIWQHCPVCVQRSACRWILNFTIARRSDSKNPQKLVRNPIKK